MTRIPTPTFSAASAAILQGCRKALEKQPFPACKLDFRLVFQGRKLDQEPAAMAMLNC